MRITNEEYTENITMKRSMRTTLKSTMRITMRSTFSLGESLFRSTLRIAIKSSIRNTLKNNMVITILTPNTISLAQHISYVRIKNDYTCVVSTIFWNGPLFIGRGYA